ncbi:MAG: type II secretion system protein, partial [Candidatus Berkelbacteria bacterium]|nr:type II secretion system protein [Candidatus Berkelbacteria bacterium]
MKKLHNKKGFTLLEILIASAIFVGIMIITVGTFSWAAGYNNRLHETRRVAQNGRTILSEISTQARLANGSINFNASNNLMDEIILLSCPGMSLSGCSPKGNIVPERYSINSTGLLETGSFIANAVIILQKDQKQAILYQTTGSGESFNVIKKVKSITDWGIVLTPGDFNSIQTQNLNESGVSAAAYFGGYGPVRASKTQQPYVEFYLFSQT